MVGGSEALWRGRGSMVNNFSCPSLFGGGGNVKDDDVMRSMIEYDTIPYHPTTIRYYLLLLYDKR